MEDKPSFIITIDVEADNLWAKPKIATTKNAVYLNRFQELCEKYGFRPTYLVDGNMARDKVFKEFGEKIISSDKGEIGMHLHPWDTPPKCGLDDYISQPVLVDYPVKIMKKKIRYMTKLLEKTFDIKVYSHRAGRWNFNEIYAGTLVEYGYRIDCSVTPNISWGGWSWCGDYRDFPEFAYFLDVNDIKIPGDSPLLEVPVTILKSQIMSNSLLNRLLPFKKRTFWFRPKVGNLDSMLRIIDIIIKEKRDYIEFMMHSPELMPNGSPTFKTANDIENLYKDLEVVFKRASELFVSRTLKEYYDIKRGED